jgi:hypothetical protein
MPKMEDEEDKKIRSHWQRETRQAWHALPLGACSSLPLDALE